MAQEPDKQQWLLDPEELPDTVAGGLDPHHRLAQMLSRVQRLVKFMHSRSRDIFELGQLRASLADVLEYEPDVHLRPRRHARASIAGSRDGLKV